MGSQDGSLMGGEVVRLNGWLEVRTADRLHGSLPPPANHQKVEHINQLTKTMYKDYELTGTEMTYLAPRVSRLRKIAEGIAFIVLIVAFVSLLIWIASIVG